MSFGGMSSGVFVGLVSAIAALGGLLFGYDTGIISAALLFVGHSLAPHGGTLSDLAKQIITSAIVAGALVGCMTAGPLSDRIGRKRVVMLAAINGLAWVFIWRFVPETRGRSLEQIETDLQEGHFQTS